MHYKQQQFLKSLEAKPRGRVLERLSGRHFPWKTKAGAQGRVKCRQCVFFHGIHSARSREKEARETNCLWVSMSRGSMHWTLFWALTHQISLCSGKQTAQTSKWRVIYKHHKTGLLFIFDSSCTRIILKLTCTSL